MNVTDNQHNLQKRIDYALANLSKNAPDISSKMSWHFTDVGMSSRFRKMAGRCTFWRATDEIKLEFSESIFNGMSEMDKTDTVIHELAHGICFRLNLERGHGPEFKRICKLMGGSGERLARVEPGVVKRNLVKRWICVSKSNCSKLHIMTKASAARYVRVTEDGVNLGVVQVDVNSKTVKWLQVMAESVRQVNPLTKFNLIP